MSAPPARLGHTEPPRWHNFGGEQIATWWRVDHIGPLGTTSHPCRKVGLLPLPSEAAPPSRGLWRPDPQAGNPTQPGTQYRAHYPKKAPLAASPASHTILGLLTSQDSRTAFARHSSMGPCWSIGATLQVQNAGVAPPLQREEHTRPRPGWRLAWPCWGFELCPSGLFRVRGPFPWATLSPGHAGRVPLN